MIIEHWRDGELYEKLDFTCKQVGGTIITTLPIGLIELATYDQLRFNKKTLLCLLTTNEP